jgi:ParB-like chromosome segregation protein Spo0J
VPERSASPLPESLPYQFLPPPLEYEALKADIAARGIQVPVEFDENGNVLDGHTRLQIAGELGLTSFPRVVRAGLSEVEKQEHALALNLSRRHLTRDQRRHVVVTLRGRGWSSRRIAAVTGISAPTVLRDLRAAGVSDVTPDQPA